MNTALKAIAKTRIGYQFRSRIEPDPNGTHRVIQIKNFSDQGELDVAGLETVLVDKRADNYTVNKGDVLFLSRGPRNFAFPVPTLEHQTIAAGVFFIVRINDESVVPEYLAWYLNQSPTQNFIKYTVRRGTHMPMVPKSAFEELVIEIPSLETQNKIVAVNRLYQREEELTKQILEKRSALIEALSLKAVSHDSTS